MIRRIIHIDETKCNGCGACASACHEGAIGMVSGKAHLMREDYCDGLGDCLPACPTGAITFEEREAPAYDEAAVLAAKAAAPAGGGCPGSRARMLKPVVPPPAAGSQPSQLRQWPVQIQLAPVRAPWLDGADLLIAADCAAYARGDFHQRYMRGKVTLIGCPKLDAYDYAEKLTALITHNDIVSVTVIRMEVPCCSGLVRAVESALTQKPLPLRIITLGTDGEIRENIER